MLERVFNCGFFSRTATSSSSPAANAPTLPASLTESKSEDISPITATVTIPVKFLNTQISSRQFAQRSPRRNAIYAPELLPEEKKCMEAKDYSQLQTTYEQRLLNTPKDIDVRLRLVILLHNLGDPDQQVTTHQKFIIDNNIALIDPNDMLKQGKIQLIMGKYESAGDFFKAIDPHRMEKILEAVWYFSEASKSEPESSVSPDKIRCLTFC